MALSYWENVAQSILYSTDIDEQCLNVLSLSYRYLPAHLKPCFLLLGAFLEDEEINVKDVFKLWIAEGFIEHFDDIRFEDVAAYYLWELLMRNLIFVVMVDYMGNVLTFKVHDLVREMCQQTAKKEKFLPVFETSGTMMRERQIVINREVNSETITFDAPVRCLICNKGCYGINNLYNLKLLRTLSKVVSTLTSESIFQQVNLRYLKIYLAYIPSQWREFAMSLTFPSCLRELRLFSCGVDWEELTMMVGSLPHLEKLSLLQNSVIGSVWTPVEGKFCHLKILTIDGCGDLVCWNADNSHFPVLKYLYLRDLCKLIEFPSSLGEIATLEQIELRFCSASSTISAMRTLVEQEELANESLQLSVYFRGDEETMESFKNEIREEGLTSSTNLSLRLIVEISAVEVTLLNDRLSPSFAIWCGLWVADQDLIVARCKGLLPLAIVAVGGHLRKSPTALGYWENVAQSILYPTEIDEQCLNVLSLSYRYLPAQLKPCFLLLGAFPEDEEIYAQEVL
ncbi:hypothetical protein SASPL_130151 [Salvia splendens]|uniref:Disease resistance protein winged helix domain-containing protein n=1 Tax=Salvia splendens TaxID=180675 RepID=A0A8X8X695_SALSN|nr:hypothetical protein SASPL_130151 [Salvia splendens]